MNLVAATMTWTISETPLDTSTTEAVVAAGREEVEGEEEDIGTSMPREDLSGKGRPEAVKEEERNGSERVPRLEEPSIAVVDHLPRPGENPPSRPMDTSARAKATPEPVEASDYSRRPLPKREGRTWVFNVNGLLINVPFYMPL